ncbi:hypothetical protein ACHAW6_003661 [Cyclotella cf. meneghiniana]
MDDTLRRLGKRGLLLILVRSSRLMLFLITISLVCLAMPKLPVPRSSRAELVS